MLNIPEHKNCANCGECCGLIPATSEEIVAIRKYLDKHSDINPRKGGIDCPFRNNEAKRCDIYPVRPVVCRLMGVCKGMECPHGNTCEIDGNLFLKHRDVGMLLNFIKW